MASCVGGVQKRRVAREGVLPPPHRFPRSLLRQLAVLAQTPQCRSPGEKEKRNDDPAVLVRVRRCSSKFGTPLLPKMKVPGPSSVPRSLVIGI